MLPYKMVRLSWLLLIAAAASYEQALAQVEAEKEDGPRLVLKGHAEIALRVQYSPDGKRLATAAADKTAALWDASTGKRLFTLRGHADFVGGLAFSPDGTRLATASGDRTVRVWDAATGQNTHTLRGHNVWVIAVAFSPDGTQVASGDLVALDQAETRFTGEVKLWDARTGKRNTALRGHGNGVVSLAYSPDGKRLASGGVDGTIIVWELASGKPALAFWGHREDVMGLAFSPAGRRLASASRDGAVRVWDLVRLTRSGRKPTTRAGDRDLTAEKEALTLKGHEGRVLCVAFSPDGRRLASAGFHDDNQCRSLGEVRVWDAHTGRQLAALEGGPGENGTYGLAFSPDGTRLATAHGDRTVKVWDVANLIGRARAKEPTGRLLPTKAPAGD
jgi:WD40 repeat protein